MRYSKWLAGFALALGMALPGASALSAADPYWDMRHDSFKVDRLRSEIARDRARLNEDIRRHRYQAAAQDRRELARDERALEAALRDIRHDRGNAFLDRRFR